MILGHKMQLKMLTAALLAVLLITSVFSACNNNNNSTTGVSVTENPSDTKVGDDFAGRGNSTGNIVSGGIVTESDGYMYFRAGRNNKFKIMKQKIGTDEKVQIAEDNAMYINVWDGWVYYSNISYALSTAGAPGGTPRIYKEAEKYSLWKVKTDGTGKTKVSDDKFLYTNIVDGWIYYSNTAEGGAIFKMRVDGTERTKLNNDDSMYLNVVGDWIYFSNRTDNYRMYKIKTDGSTPTVLEDDNIITRLVVHGDYIYYINASTKEKDSLYRMKLDGSGRTRITSNMVNNFTINGNWIYYINESDAVLSSIYKMKLTGGSNTKLSFDQDYHVAVAGNLVFYSMDMDGRNIFTVPTGNEYAPDSTIAKDVSYNRNPVD